MTYMIAYVKTQKKFIIHYVKPTAQLLFRMFVGSILIQFLNWIVGNQISHFLISS